jgi:hypothetical protein
MTAQERETYLERLISQRTGDRLTFVLSAAIEKLTEEMAQDILKDEEFRRGLREMVKRNVAAWMTVMGSPRPEQDNGGEAR